MLERVLNPPLSTRVVDVSQVTTLELYFLASFIISLLYLTKSKLSYCTTVEQLFHVKDNYSVQE